MDKPVEAISFVVADRDGDLVGTTSFNWTIWAHGTSFYLKVRHPSMSELKISLHGPDPRPGLVPVYRLGPDSSFKVQDGTNYGGLIVGESDGRWPIKFTGQRVTSHVQHVIRFSYSSEMFTPGVPNGLPVGLSKRVLKKGGRHGRYTIPPEGGLFVDLYISAPGANPYWQDTIATREANAGLGPLINTAGQSLTLVASKVSDPHKHDPTWQRVTEEEAKEMGKKPVVRALAMNPSSTGLMWITEKIAPVDFGPDVDKLYVGQYRPDRQV